MDAATTSHMLPSNTLLSLALIPKKDPAKERLEQESLLKEQGRATLRSIGLLKRHGASQTSSEDQEPRTETNNLQPGDRNVPQPLQQ